MTDALDAMHAAPDHHEVLLENDRVRVLDTCVAPGEHTPVHAHASSAALYVMSWSDFLRGWVPANHLRTAASLVASGLLMAAAVRA